MEIFGSFWIVFPKYIPAIKQGDYKTSKTLTNKMYSIITY